MKTAVVVFPGSNCDRDVQRAVSESLNTAVDMVWHENDNFASGTDLVVLPGGFSYGDYLRSGAMAARSPIIKAVREHADRGGRVPDPDRNKNAAGSPASKHLPHLYMPQMSCPGGTYRQQIHCGPERGRCHAVSHSPPRGAVFPSR